MEPGDTMSIDACYAMVLCKPCEATCNESVQECGMFKDDHFKKYAAKCQGCANERKSMDSM